MEDRKTILAIVDNGFQPERENQVGILCFVNHTNPGFSGTLKQRYTDFIVNEIMPNGTVVHLTNDKAPILKPIPKAVVKAEALLSKAVSFALADAPSETTPIAHETESSAAIKIENLKPTSNNGEPQAFVVSEIDKDLLTSYLGPDLKDEIMRFHEKVLAKPDAKPAVFGHLLSPPITDKVVRGRMHQDVRRIFESRLETQMMDEGAIKITAAPRTSKRHKGVPQQQHHRNQSHSGQPKGKVGWDELGGQHLHFSLYKENKDTMEVINFLATRLRVKPKDFAFAGTKDRRAATTQRVSVFRQNSNTLAKLNHELRNARIGNYNHEKHQLELGELAGNLFTITLRDCHFGNDADLDEFNRVRHATGVIGSAVMHLREHGFINYYGLQRFGTFSIGTDEIGKNILKGDFQGAVEGILSFNKEALECALNPLIDASEYPVSKDDINRAHAIHLFKTTGKANQALERLPRKFSAEHAVIRHLGISRTSGDYLGALMMVNRNLRTMYVHAYQSLVWNYVASERWTRYGSKVVEGDLVIVDTQGIKDAVKDEVDENGEIVVHPASDDVAVTHDDLYERARALTAEEAESGEYSIFDIVLPTPGYDMEYPLNDIGDYYKTFMASKNGGGLDPANMRRNQKDFSLSGNYRKVMARVQDLNFQVKVYNEELEQLVETDLEKLDKSKPKPQSKGINDHNPNDHSQHLTNNGQQNNRGGRGGSRGGSRGDWGGHNQYRSNARQDAERNKSMYAGSAQLNAWATLPGKLAAEDKAAAAVAEQQREAQMKIDPKTIKQPVIRDTWIQTSAENEGRRTGYKSTLVIPGFDGAADTEEESDSGAPIVKVAKIPSPPSPPSRSPLREHHAPIIRVDMDVDTKQPTSPTSPMDMDTKPSTAFDAPTNITSPVPVKLGHKRLGSDSTISSDSDGGVQLTPQQPAPKRSAEEISKTAETKLEVNVKDEIELDVPEVEVPRLAVIVQFRLGSSQYATMALRELMKAGGVKTYKPEFSGGR